jgi:LSD1 subclass zinc finger protein
MQMGLFKRPAADDPTSQFMQQAMQMQQQALQMQQQMMAAQAQALEGQGALSSSGGQTAPAGPAPAVGSGLWVRQVLSIIAPPQPGFVKRCSCVVCGAPKKLPAVTAYVYCDYCASLMDYDLRRACEGDVAPSPAYAVTANSILTASRGAVASGDRDGHRELQRRLFESYVQNVPMAVSHRARNDSAYRQEYIGYMAEVMTIQAFDPRMQALDAELRQRVMALRYSGPMMSPTVEPETFWPMVDTVQSQRARGRELADSDQIRELDPDHAGHLSEKFAWSLFCQGWLGLLPPDAAERLLDRAGLKNEYVPIQADDGQPRHCGGCGGEFSALPGAAAIICDRCGRKMDLGTAEIPCASCGGSLTMPAGADRVACPYCQSQVARSGMR